MHFKSLFFLLFACLLGQGLALASSMPMAARGTIDMRDEVFGAEPFELVGEWEFYWDQFIAPTAVPAEPSYRFVPLPWSENGQGHTALPAFGKATYRLIILLPDEHPSLVLRFPEIFTAYNLFINGKAAPLPLRAGLSDEDTQASRRTIYVPIEADERRLEIVLQVANWVSGTAGIWRAVQLGSLHSIMELRSRQQFHTLMTVCSLCIMGVYHFVLFLFRRERKDNLWFSIFCICVFVRSFFVGNDLLIYNVLDDMNWTLSRRIEFNTYYAATVLMAFFLRELYPGEMPRRYLKFLMVYVGFNFLAVCILPHVIFRKTLLPMQISSILTIAVCVWTLILATARRRPQARIMLCGIVAMALCILHDIINAQLRFDSLELTSLGVVASVVATSIIISKRFSSAFDQLEIAQAEIKIHNEHLDGLVKEKTMDIHSILSNIPQAVFAIQRDGTLNAEASDFFVRLFAMPPSTPHAQVFQAVFRDSTVSADQISRVISVVDMALGDDELNFNLNRELLPLKMVRTFADQKRVFEIDWSPIVEGRVVQKILVSMRDTTEIAKLRQTNERSEKRVRILSEIIDKNPAQAIATVERAERDIEMLRAQAGIAATREATLRVLHTLKGNARGAGLDALASSIHHAEQVIQTYGDGVQNALDELQDEIGFLQNFLNGFRARQETTDRPTRLDEVLGLALHPLNSLAFKLGKETPECVGLENLQARSLLLAPETAQVFLDALQHLLSNAMDHGIENAEERLQQGKPVRATLHFSSRVDDAEWILALQDDGRGLDVEAVRGRAQSRGWLAPTDPDQVAALLIRSGFSTRDTVSEISGRGVGLDAVAHRLQSIGGRLELKTFPRPGQNPGLIFRLHVPRALMMVAEAA